MNAVFRGQGFLHYRAPKELERFRLVLEVEPALVDYYRALLPPTLSFARQKYSPHITIVREESLPFPDRWGVEGREGELIQFHYESGVEVGEEYAWLKAWCPRAHAIREALGLDAMSAYTRPPDESDTEHITLGNRKMK